MDHDKDTLQNELDLKVEKIASLNVEIDNKVFTLKECGCLTLKER